MSRSTRFILISATIIFCLVVGSGEAIAKGGRGGKRSFSGGGSKGAGSFKSSGRSVRGGTGSFSPSNSGRAIPGARQGGPNFKREMSAAPSLGKSGGIRQGTDLGMIGNGNVISTNSLDHHRSRELNKLNHRRQISDQLRSISGRNGNENLNRVADEMDRRAQDHFDRQMAKFDPSYIRDDSIVDQTGQLTDVPNINRIEDPTTLDPSIRPSDPLFGATQKLTGTENALSRQVRNEERKLFKRLESVDRMRELAAQSGDSELLQTADRLEEWAMNDFDSRMIKVTDFQQRHGLPDVSNYLSQ